MIVATPEIALVVVWTVDHVAILCDANDVTVAVVFNVLPALLDSEANWVGAASLQVLAHIWGLGGAGIAVTLVGAW